MEKEYALIEITMSSGVTRRIFRAGGWRVAKRIIKTDSNYRFRVGVWTCRLEIKKKGLIPGAVHVGLDVTPVIGTAKGVVEIFTWRPDPTTKRIASKSYHPLANSFQRTSSADYADFFTKEANPPRLENLRNLRMCPECCPHKQVVVR
jgi:hypothetical protein